MSSVVHFDGVSKYFQDGIIPSRQYALTDVSFELESGKTYAYLGPNGAGKTTTLKLLLGFLSPDSGNITLYGRKPAEPVSRVKTGYVSDNPYFYEYLTGREYLSFCGDLYRLPKSFLRERIPAILEEVGLPHAAGLKLRKFSRGMAQRLNFAQAILHDPDLIILDEPFNGLDPFGRYDLRNIIKKLKTMGKTIFFSSHILEDAEILADEALFINKGKIIHRDSMEAIYTRFNDTYQIHASGDRQELELTLKQAGKGIIQDNILLNETNRDNLDNYLNLIKKSKLSLLKVEKSEKKLEEIFVEIYKKYANN